METIEVSSACLAISSGAFGSGGYWRAQAPMVAVDLEVYGCTCWVSGSASVRLAG